MTTETVESYFRRNGVKHSRSSSGSYGVNLLFDCPVCGRQKKASINNSTWLWQCFSSKCGATGNELVLKRERGDIYDVTGEDGIDLEQLKIREFAAALAARVVPRNDVERWSFDLWHDDAAEHARAYLASRGISKQTAEKCSIGWSAAWPGKQPQHEFGMLMLPVLAEPGETSKCAMVKVRTLNPDVPKNERYRRLAGGESILFAPCGIEPSRTVVLVGGEIDAISLVQAGWENVVSTTTGEDSWSDVYTRQLEACHDIVVIYDNDDAGKQGAEKVVATLGVHRCRIGRWPDEYNDANDVLKAELSEFDVFYVQTIVNAARVPKLSGIIEPGSLRDAILAELAGLTNGWRTGWRDVDDQFGGWRPGEVTIVTGDTGCGKTSWTSQAALYQARAYARPVLYMPPEMGPKRQLMKWMRQWARKSPRKMSETEAALLIGEIGALPIYLFHADSFEPERMRNTLWYAYARLGVRFVVIDHLHAMVSSGKDERVELDALIKTFAKFATESGAHVVIVAHPHQLPAPQNKDRDNQIVQLGDLKGSSSLKQWGDNVISIWRGRKANREGVVDKDGYGTSISYFLKVRDEDGQEGRVLYRYDIEGALFLDDSAMFGVIETPKPHWTDQY